MNAARLSRVAPRCLVILVLLASVDVEADCACICIEGLNRPLCSSSTEIEPVCPPKYCPESAPASRAIDPPSMPPTGTRECAMQYVYNRYSQRYEWRRLCR